jgi:hypothetical protein
MPGLEAIDHDLPNPLDRIERLAEAHHWSFDRSTPSEVVMRLEGGWSDLSLSMCWREDLETLQVAAAFDLKVPPLRREEVGRLLALINEQQLHGHFDLWPSDGSIIYRNSLLLAGGAEANDAQCEAMIQLALAACERYFPALQFVIWAGRSAVEALDSSLLETMGEA